MMMEAWSWPPLLQRRQRTMGLMMRRIESSSRSSSRKSCVSRAGPTAALCSTGMQLPPQGSGIAAAATDRKAPLPTMTQPVKCLVAHVEARWSGRQRLRRVVVVVVVVRAGVAAS